MSSISSFDYEILMQKLNESDDWLRQEKPKFPDNQHFRRKDKKESVDKLIAFGLLSGKVIENKDEDGNETYNYEAITVTIDNERKFQRMKLTGQFNF